jgi:hypothetical protein
MQICRSCSRFKSNRLRQRTFSEHRQASFRRTAIRNIEVDKMIEARLPLPWPHKDNLHARRAFISKAPLKRYKHPSQEWAGELL